MIWQSYWWRMWRVWGVRGDYNLTLIYHFKLWLAQKAKFKMALTLLSN